MIRNKRNVIDGIFFGMTTDEVFGAYVTNGGDFIRFKSDKTLSIEDHTGVTVLTASLIEGYHVMGAGPFSQQICWSYAREGLQSLEEIFRRFTKDPGLMLHGFLEYGPVDGVQNRVTDAVVSAQVGYSPADAAVVVQLSPGDVGGVLRYRNKEVMPFRMGIPRVTGVEAIAERLAKGVVPMGSAAVIACQRNRVTYSIVQQ